MKRRSCFERGEGTKPNAQAARVWYRKGCDLGYEASCAKVGK